MAKIITLLGVEGCPTCARLDAHVEKALTTLTNPVTLKRSPIPQKINAGGLPAVLVDGEVKALRRVPEVEELRKWLQ